MSEIWTPGSDQGNPGQAPQPQPAEQPQEGAAMGIPGFENLSEEEQQLAMDELRQIQEYLAASPAIDIIANHAVGMYELASLHLGKAKQSEADPAEKAKRLGEAALAIQAMQGIIQTMSSQLGNHKPGLDDAANNLQQVYAQLAQA
jgi:hypothetical protein